MKDSLSLREPTLGERVGTMLRVDFMRMSKSRTFYIVIAAALIVPILMTVMMSMMDGMESVDQQTGETVIIEGPENAWQSIGTLPGEGAEMGGMDVMALCNINMCFMGVSAFVCLFVSEDFRSGYSKNLFTVRARRGEYILSKTLLGFVAGALMLIAYLIGTMIGGAVSNLSFDLMGLSALNIVMCILAKIFLMPVFVSIFVLISVAAKQRAWLSICGSLGGGMLLFMTVSLITPLGSTPMNVLLCLVGGLLFATGLGSASNLVLKKTSLV